MNSEKVSSMISFSFPLNDGDWAAGTGEAVKGKLVVVSSSLIGGVPFANGVGL